MAEGGVPSGSGKDDPEDTNPYSFQKFIKKQETSKDDDDNRKPRRPENGENTQRPTVRREENPFSFKQFLNKETPNKPKVYSLIVDDISETCGGSRSRTLTPDLATDLPDFVQDHIIADASPDPRHSKNNITFESRNSRLSSSSSSNNPNDLLNSHSFPDLTPEEGTNRDHVHHHNGINELSVVNVEEECQNGSHQEAAGILPLSLPDFLSDGPMLNHVPVSDDDTSYNAASSSTRCSYFHVQPHENEDNSELQNLRRANSDLTHQFNSCRALAESATNKVLGLEKDVSVLQAKETAETAALEEMVRKVEKNLQLTTQRAIRAEGNAMKLKQEIKSLQNQVKILTTENNSLKVGGGSSTSQEVKLKASNISKMLSGAADEAEKSLKQLMTGVEHLRFISNVAQDIDKISDPEMTSGDQ